jgi:hypothetical protein
MYSHEFTLSSRLSGRHPRFERRSTVRYPCHVETYCQPASGRDDELWWRGEIRNVSGGGIGLILTRGFEVGRYLEIELPLAVAGTNSTLVRVVYAAKQSSGSWLVGCSFTQRLTDEQVQAILASAALTEAATPVGQ